MQYNATVRFERQMLKKSQQIYGQIFLKLLLQRWPHITSAIVSQTFSCYYHYTL